MRPRSRRALAFCPTPGRGRLAGGHGGTAQKEEIARPRQLEGALRAAAMPVDLKIEDLKADLCAARDELDKWVDKQISSLQSRKANHEDEIVKSNGTHATCNYHSRT